MAIAEKGSVSAAAGALSISQPALSRMLSQSERALGVRLFERTGRGVVLTAAGRQFCEHAEEVVHRHNFIRHDLKDLDGQLAGSVGIAVPESVARVLFVPLVRRFKHMHPNLTLRVTTSLTGNIPDLIKAGTADVGVVTDIN